jgi:hypothetical protein
MSKHKEQAGELVELAKIFEEFLVVFKANTLPTPDGGRKIDHWGLNPLNEKVQILLPLLSKIYCINKPNGQAGLQNEKKGIRGQITRAWLGLKSSSPLHIILKEGEKVEGAETYKRFREVLLGLPWKRTTNSIQLTLMELPDGEKPFEGGQVFSSEAVARLEGAAEMLRKIAGAGNVKPQLQPAKDSTVRKNVSDLLIYRKVLFNDLFDFRGSFQSSLVPSAHGSSFKLCENVEFLNESLNDLLECKYKMLKSTPAEDMKIPDDTLTAELALLTGMEGLNNGLRPLLKSPYKFRPGLKFRPGAFVSVACKELIETSIQTSLFYCEKLIDDTKANIASTKQNVEKAKSQPEKLSAKARVLAVWTEHPEWSDTKIAKAAGISRTTLYDYPEFKNLRATQKEGKKRIRRGSKTKDGTIEAIDK